MSQIFSIILKLNISENITFKWQNHRVAFVTTRCLDPKQIKLWKTARLNTFQNPYYVHVMIHLMPVCALFVSAVLLLYWSKLLFKVLSCHMVASSLWLNLNKLHDTATLVNTVPYITDWGVCTTETWIVLNFVSLETGELYHEGVNNTH